MAPYSSTLAWKIPWMEEPDRLQSMGSRSRTRLSDFTFTFHFHALEKEKGNGNPLQYSCLENPTDGGAWWAAVCGVTQSRTQLKRLSSMDTLSLTKEAKIHNGEQTISLTSGAGKTGQPLVKE